MSEAEPDFALSDAIIDEAMRRAEKAIFLPDDACYGSCQRLPALR